MLIVNIIIIPSIGCLYKSALLSHPDLVDIGITSDHMILPCCIWFMVLLRVLTSHDGVIVIYIVSMAMTIFHNVVSFSHVIV